MLSVLEMCLKKFENFSKRFRILTSGLELMPDMYTFTTIFNLIYFIFNLIF